MDRRNRPDHSDRSYRQDGRGPVGLARALGVALCLLLLGAAGAPALTLNYGNQQNANIEFNDIEETATNPDPPLFLADGNAANLFLAGTTLVFDVDPDFFAETTLVAGDFTDSTLRLDIVVPNGSSFRISEVIIRESGDYNLSGDGEAQVVTNLEWRVTQIDFVANLLALQQDTMTFSPAGTGGNAPTGHYTTPGDSGGQWSGILSADVDSLTTGATAIEIFTVNNELETFSYDGGTNRIQKKQFEIEVVLVPEPATVAMLAMGLGALAVAGRRR